MFSRKFVVSIAIVLALAACVPSSTATPSLPSTAGSESETKTPQKTKLPPSTQQEVLATEPGGAIAPYPDAALCPDSAEAHDYSLFHTLWDGARGCHYEHEHGQDPFTSEVASAFPGFDLRALIGDVGVGHTNPSSAAENTHKHGGFKWDVTLSHTAGCLGGDGYPTGVDAMVIQYHAFGDYSIEFESRTHSAVGLLRQCQTGNPGDYGFVFVNQLQDYGQRVSPYQGGVLPYPDVPVPSYDANRAPYFSVVCFGTTSLCSKYPSRESILKRNNVATSTWISAPNKLPDSGSHLFALLFRVRDTYQALDDSDLTYPFTFAWLCSEDDGATYSAAPGCTNNNTTTRIHEVMGEIPEQWDNLDGFDTDPRAGRITADGYVTRFGDLNQSCTAPGTDCHPIKLVQAFSGRYLSQFSLLQGEKANFTPGNLPERDIYFCNGAICAEDGPGATSAGWVGSGN